MDFFFVCVCVWNVKKKKTKKISYIYIYSYQCDEQASLSRPENIKRYATFINRSFMHNLSYAYVRPCPLSPRPVSTMELTGPFSLTDMHGWLTRCLPDLASKYVRLLWKALVCRRRQRVSPFFISPGFLKFNTTVSACRPPQDVNELKYKSAFLGTHLECTYRCWYNFFLSSLLSERVNRSLDFI